MPRTVRNFWHELQVEGRASTIATGPRSKDGAFSESIFIRDGGSIRKALRIEGFAIADGRLEIIVYDADGKQVHKVEARR